MRTKYIWVLKLLALGCVMGFAVLGGCGKKEGGKIAMKLGHVLDSTHPVHKAMEKMAEIVKEKTNGDITIEIYPSGQLGAEPALIEQVQQGALAMTKTSTSTMESFSKKMALFSLPFLFRDDEHRWKVLEGPMGKELLDAADDVGLKGLCYYDAGWRSIYTARKPVRTVADAAGLHIRIQDSPMMRKIMEALGANPETLSWGEVYQALENGVVDAAENNPPSIASAKHNEVAKYYTQDQHSAPPDILVISMDWWKRLTPEQQKILLDAAEESSQYERELWNQETDKIMKSLEENGMEIIKLDPAAKQGFIDKTMVIYDNMKTENPELFELSEKIKAVN